MTKAKVSSKYQIVIPKKIREKTNIKKGDVVKIIPMKDGVYITTEPENWTEYGRGLGKEIWKDIDPLEYIRKERESWREREKVINKAWQKKR